MELRVAVRERQGSSSRGMVSDESAHQRDLAAVQAAIGDDAAFAALIAEHRAALRAHCYRMLGSLADSDDAMQETMFRAWRALATFRGRSSARTWLTTIATNVCLRMLDQRRRRRLPTDGPPATLGETPGRPMPDAYWLEPIPTELVDQAGSTPEEVVVMREGVELAFVAALQLLAPRQRAALLLRDVLGFSAEQTAGALDTSVAAANSATQRARAAIATARPDRSQQMTLRALGDTAVVELVGRYTDAMQRHDLPAVLGLLTDDAYWAMPPEATWYSGRDAVATFLVEHPFSLQWRHRACSANGQPAVFCETWDEVERRFVPCALDVLTLAGDRIASVTAFRTRYVLDRFSSEQTLE